MLTDIRKKKLTELAEYIAMAHRRGHVVILEDIVRRENLHLHYDSYERTFDGMLVYDEEDFHIHIDNDSGNWQGSKKGNFTLAHELAHYFIDEHRIGLKNFAFPPHGSRFDLGQQDPKELEADHFASNLLMPAELFRGFKTPREFSMNTIWLLADHFQTSFMSTALRFSDIGNHSTCIVFSRENEVKWFKKSSDFPAWPFRFKVGGQLPAHTVAGDFYRNRSQKYTTVENIDPAAWFFPAWHVADAMHEQCYYSESYNYVLSVLWFD